MRHLVIGAGGVNSWLIAKLVRAAPGEYVRILDGDRLEERNLDRQLFDFSDIGKLKAEALAIKYRVDWQGDFFTSGTLRLEESDLLWVGVDNHSARREALDACDLYGCQALLGANEETDAEAYYYRREWGGGPNDPRVIYPSILTDRSGDPLRPVGCIEAAQEHGQVQTVLANGLAADFMLHLYWAWYRSPEIAEEYRPVHHKSSIYSLKTIRLCDRTAPACA